MRFRQHVPTVLIALVVSAVSVSIPAIAEVVKQAVNADKVDGKHAVGAAASKAARAKKLVATNKQGLLPGNILLKAPNSHKVDGRHANELVRIARTQGQEAALTTEDAQVVSTTINAPKAGFVLVNFDTGIIGTGCPCEAWTQLWNVTTDQQLQNYRIGRVEASDAFSTLAHSWVFRVVKGDNELVARAFRFLGTTLYLDAPKMSVLYVPFGATGGATISNTGRAGTRSATSTD